jgi:hypothetical protein
MITSGQKTSLLVPYQLPEFIRDNPDYSNFVLFLQAYYEWLETQNNVTDRSKNLLNYKDVDTTTDEFIQYFYNDFLSYFPTEILANKTEVLKVAKQLYQAKGTPASFQFFFRTLYDTDVEFFYTKDAVLKASSGKWYIAKSLKVYIGNLNPNINFSTFDPTILKNYRVFGETTKSIATIENATTGTNKAEIFISNIERLFQSGEFVRVVDNSNQDIYFLNSHIVPATTPGATILRGKIVGQISQIQIDSNNRGQKYQGANINNGYPGDPIAIYGGLNSNTGHGATATVGTSTKGSLQQISVATGGFGYTNGDTTQNAYSVINITNGGGAVANISGLNPSTVYVSGNSFYNPVSTLTNISTDVIGLKANISLGVTANANSYTWNGTTKYNFANSANANATTTIANALSFIAFSAYPISAITVLNSGGGIPAAPGIAAQSLYYTEGRTLTSDLASLGILGPIQVNNPGTGYVANDKILITGGSGYGAYANVITVSANGAITNVAYVYSTTGNARWPLGGMGYRLTNLPTLTVNSSNVSASNASLSVAGLAGQGASFGSSTDRVGTITTINISDYGEDYVANPNVSFKVQDIVVTGLSFGNVPGRGDTVYQGPSFNASTYQAKVDSLISVQNNLDFAKSIFLLRVYDYNSTPNISLPIKAYSKTYSATMTTAYDSTILSEYDGINVNRYNNGVITYGDGSAKGNSTFLNGLTLGQGQYLDTTGQPSSFDVLQSTVYNNYTYQITLEKEIAKYRSALLNLLHPTGLKVLGRYAMKSNSSYNLTLQDALQSGYSLYHYTGANASYGILSTAITFEDLMNGGLYEDEQDDILNPGEVSPEDLLIENVTINSFTGGSTNIITFGNLYGANLASFIFPNSSITLVNSDGEAIYSEVSSVNPYQNQVTLRDNVWLAFANVASASVTAGGNTINIANVYTSSYNIVNDGIYSDANNPLKDIVHVNDYVLINNEIKLVSAVNYTTKIITIANNFTYSATGNLSLQRVIIGYAQEMQIFGPQGIQYVPELTTESGNRISTENGNLILIS